MHIIEETGTFQAARFVVNHLINPADWVFIPIKYSGVFWYKGLKFCFAKDSSNSDKIRIYEMSTGAACTDININSNNRDVLIRNLLSRERLSKASLCELVDTFNNNNKILVKTWEVVISFGL